MKILLLILTLIAQVGLAQTNVPATNAVPLPSRQLSLSTNSPLQAQMDAVDKAMPQYFSFEQDVVSDTKTMSLNEYEILEDTDGADLKLDVVAFIHPPSDLPAKISLHIISHSSEWRFLDDHDFTIRFGDKKLSPGNLAYSNKVLDDATVIEHVWPDFTIEQFHDLAWADTVYFKLGYKNYEITPGVRQKWKLLWKYFDLKKHISDEDLKNAIK